MEQFLILGTAGHIDHGKTSLVAALTGTNTDRLPEEKKRGITIELGFAHLQIDDVHMGIVDVPGHERFVRNMLAGATGMDLAMLIVAADDSIKPQTIEHLDILRYLDIQHGIIVITKCDLVDEDWLPLVEEEVRSLTTGTFLEKSNIIRTSAETGEGIEELKSALSELASKAIADLPTENEPFRMAIDRVFSLEGHGTVVTGSVSAGTVTTGDTVEIQPLGEEVRIRRLQNHFSEVESVGRGQRAAINLAGIHHDEIGRGQELAEIGHLVPHALITIKLDVLDSIDKPLKNRERVRVHIGTSEIMATMRLVGSEALNPGESGFAQLFLSEPAVATWNQPLVIRKESPVSTIAGGRVLDCHAQRIRLSDIDVDVDVSSEAQPIMSALADLVDGNEKARVAASMLMTGLHERRGRDLARTCGVVNPSDALSELTKDGILYECKVSPTHTILIHVDALEVLWERVNKYLNRLHDENPLQLMFDAASVRSRFEYVGSATLLNHVFSYFRSLGRLTVNAGKIGLPDRGPQLSKNDKKLMADLIERIKSGGVEPPFAKGLESETGTDRQRLDQLLAVAEGNGDIVRISEEFYLASSEAEKVRAKLSENWEKGCGKTLAEVRDLLGTTRKYVVPLCEYLDHTGFTVRKDDLRFLSNQ